MMKIDNPPWELMAKAKGANKTASGPIVSVNDALAAPLRSLVANIEPVQDLHGYNSPWPAGGGKNLYNKDADTYGQGLYWNSSIGELRSSNDYYASPVIPIVPNTQYSRTSGTNANLFFDVNGDYIGYEYTGGTFTSPANAYFAAFNIANSIDHDTVQFEQGSSLSSYSPYSNICPISGWSECKVWRTGKNLLPFEDVLAEGWTNTLNGVTATYSNGYMRVTGTNTSSGWTNIVFFQAAWYSAPLVFKAGSYAMPEHLTLSVKIDGTSYTNIGVPFTVQSSIAVRGFYISVRAGETVDWNIPMMFVCGSDRPTSFEPYQANTYTIQLGQTVYGGTFDVTNGVLTVDRAIYIPTGNESGYTQQTGRVAFALPTEYRVPGTVDRACSAFRVQTASAYCYVYTDLSVDGLKSYFQQNDVQIVVGLATPIEIPLTATQISTLQGQNNVWADSGDVKLVYKSNSPDKSLMKLAIAFTNRR